MFRKTLIAFAAVAALGDAASAQSAYRLPSGTVHEGHEVAGGKTPTATNATIAGGSADWFGMLTATGTGNIVLTFAVAFAATPWCQVYDQTSQENLAMPAIGTTSFTIHGHASSDKIIYQCIGTSAN